MATLSESAADALHDCIASNNLTGTPDEITRALNAPRDTGEVSHAPVSMREINSTLIKRGRLLPILAATSATAKATAYMLQSPHFDTFDPSDPAAQQSLAQLVTEGLLSTEDVAALVALGASPVMRSLAMDAVGCEVDAAMVAHALEVD
jgi:hypothetical protein